MVYAIVVAVLWVLCHTVYRLRAVGIENLPKQGGYILAPNHISALDPVFVVIARILYPKMLVIAKEELFANPFLNWFFRSLGAVPIARGKADTDVLNEAVEACKNGRPLLIFPEGTRSKTGEIGTIKSGVFVIADQAGVGVVPCRVLYGTKDGKQKLFCRVKVCFGPMIPAETFDMGEKRSGAKLRACRQVLADQWQKLYEENAF